MKHLDVLANLISPPTPSVVAAIESGLLALDSDHVDAETATALMQHLCTNAPTSPTHVKAGVAIFQRLLELGGNPWEQVLPELPNAATGALQQQCSDLVVKALLCPHPPLDGLLVQDPTGRTRSTPAPWLQFSVERGMHGVVKSLLEMGMDPNERAPGETPLLHLAPTYGGIVPLLLEHGADPCALDAKGRLCVQAWPQDNPPEFVDLLARVLDRGPGLDRFSLLKLAGGRPNNCKALLKDVADPRSLVDEQGRSIFFHMAAATLDNRCYGQQLTGKQVLAQAQAALAWRRRVETLSPLDEGAARVLLWSSRVLSKQSLDQDLAAAIVKQETSCGLTGSGADGLVPYENALTCLDAMVEAGLLHDPSEIAATALAGYWKASGDVASRMLSEDLDYPAIQWLDRCFRGIRGGEWFHGQDKKHRWQGPDTPIESFRKALLDAADKAPVDRPMWSNPDMGRMLIQLLRADWPSDTRYYQMELEPLDTAWAARLRERHAPLLEKMSHQAMCEALTDPRCRDTVSAMKDKNCHIQSLVALMEYEAINETTSPVSSRSRPSSRL